LIDVDANRRTQISYYAQYISKFEKIRISLLKLQFSKKFSMLKNSVHIGLMTIS